MTREALLDEQRPHAAHEKRLRTLLPAPRRRGERQGQDRETPSETPHIERLSPLDFAAVEATRLGGSLDPPHLRPNLTAARAGGHRRFFNQPGPARQVRVAVRDSPLQGRSYPPPRGITRAGGNKTRVGTEPTAGL